VTAIKTTLSLLLTILLLCTCALAEAPLAQWSDIGTGANEMTLVVVFPDLSTKGYHIHSDQATMLEALLELELVTVTQSDGAFALLEVDGCPLPSYQPEAYWFLSVYDVALDSLVPVTTAIDQLPLAGQTYAIGMINGGTAQ